MIANHNFTSLRLKEREKHQDAKSRLTRKKNLNLYVRLVMN